MFLEYSNSLGCDVVSVGVHPTFRRNLMHSCGSIGQRRIDTRQWTYNSVSWDATLCVWVSPSDVSMTPIAFILVGQLDKEELTPGSGHIIPVSWDVTLCLWVSPVEVSELLRSFVTSRRTALPADIE